MSGRPSREEFVAFFNEADTDGSGDLSLEEVIAVLRKNGYKGSDGQIKVGIIQMFYYISKV